jgi:hypothetical protein
MKRLIANDRKISFRDGMNMLIRMRDDIPGREQIIGEQIQGNTALVSVKLILTNGSSKIRNERLVKEKGGWRLLPSFNP